MIQDLRFTWRTLSRTPGFAALVVLILGLGIGATTTVFSIANTVLLRPLPFAEMDRLYSLFENTESGARRLPSYPAFSEWRQQASVFSDISYVRGEDFVIRGEEGPQRVTAAYVAGDFFRLLGARPLLGRVFSDEGPSQAPVVVLSNSFWREHFGGDPTVIGRLISTTDGSFTVVGVMPSELAVPLWWARADVWAPIGAIPPARAYALTQWNLHVDAHVLARLRPGVSPEGAEAEMSQIARRLSQTGPAEQQE